MGKKPHLSGFVLLPPPTPKAFKHVINVYKGLFIKCLNAIWAIPLAHQTLLHLTYYLFPKVKSHLRGYHFRNNNEVVCHAVMGLQCLNIWTKFLDVKGDYNRNIEKDKSSAERMANLY